MIPRWFLYLQSFAMLIMGISLFALRPKVPGEPVWRRYTGLGAMWALFCVVVGVALLTMALGYWTWPLSVRRG